MAITWYVALADLAERPGALELSQVTLTQGKPPARPELLDALLRGEDTTPWPPAEVDVALAALKKIGDAIEESQGLIDGYLRQRGYTLPLVTVKPILTGWARAITRYKLHGHRVSEEKTDPIVRDYRDAMKLLEQMAIGKFSLGLGDTVPAAGGAPLITGPGRIFSMDSLRDYGK
ncbi:Mu-like prophage protein gp36 [Yersinia aldovae]|uniref:gp436 family protein n=1 Tax=Yersinia aldovae TaxID=29483 RepID=UPI0005DAC69B|nr:DUF1320 domain-containing protein [Yersinia aldovae]CNJ03399.1 Mu-like prophage protein gp36 [Yersinia aldovae]